MACMHAVNQARLLCRTMLSQPLAPAASWYAAAMLHVVSRVQLTTAKLLLLLLPGEAAEALMTPGCQTQGRRAP